MRDYKLRTPSWLTALGRLLTLRAASPPDKASPGVISALAVVSFALWLSLNWLSNQPAPQFIAYGLPYVGWYLLLILALALVLSRRSTPQIPYASALTIVLAATPLAVVVLWFIGTYLQGATATVVLLMAVAYFLVYVSCSSRSLTGLVQRRAVTLALAVTALFMFANDPLYVDASLWAVNADSAEESDEPADQQSSAQNEALLFSQAARIDDAVAVLFRPPKTAASAFFLGFAGTGEQRVFAEEIKLAAGVLDAKYDVTDRSLLLINDQRDLESQPLASPTALRYALRGIARKMDVERDVLFLSLSSHGSPDATISVSNGSLPLNDLGAEELAADLQEAGIKWRVIVVSACYSGTFVAPLQNPQTVVITASSADRTSFGCSDDRDLTYFGEAFYRDALPKATSLRSAFDMARDDIKRREMEEAITASRPQAWFGQEIEEKLRDLATTKQAAASNGDHVG